MSNLGAHFDANSEHGDTYAKLASAAGHLAAVTVILNPNDLMKAAPAINAAQRKVLRFINVERNMSGTDDGQHTPIENARAAAQAIAPAISIYPDAYWAYFRNEISDWSKAEFYAQEMKAWVEVLAEMGAKAAIGCFSFGTPDYHIWPTFDKAFAAANKHGGCVALHEYGVLTMKSALDASGKRGDHCLRYRKVWALYSYRQRFPNLEWMITETGLDKDINTGIGDGWRAVTTADQFISDLDWYDREITQDGIAATVFQDSALEEWGAFDIHGEVLDWLVARARASWPQLRPVETPPVVPPPPVEPPSPPPPTAINLLVNGSFEGPYTFAPDDEFGQRKIPFGWQIGWNHEQAAPHVELDQDPPHVADGSVSLRIWADNRFQAWAYQRIELPAGTYKLDAKAIGRRLAGPTRVNLFLAVDTQGRDDYALAAVKHGYTSEEEWKNPGVTFTASGLITVFAQVRTGDNGRGDGWFDDIQLVRVADAPTPPPVEPPPQTIPDPGRFIVNNSAGLNIRRQPNTSVSPVGSLNNAAPLTVDHFVEGEVIKGNPWWGEFGGLYVAGYYLKKV